MKSLGPNHPTWSNRTYADIAFSFIPETYRECKMKELCKLNTDQNNPEGRCDCYSPLSCQLVKIERNRQLMKEKENE